MSLANRADEGAERERFAGEPSVRMARAFGKLRDHFDDGESYLFRPVEWVKDKGKAFPWSKQREILESVRDNRYTAVHSAHDLGKSFIASIAMAWWNDVHPVGQAFVVSTAPSAAQVSAILWRELAKVHALAKLIGKINRAGYPQWYAGSELIGYGRKPSDYEQSAFQGIHAPYTLVVIDEACGVAKHLYDAVDSLVTNEYARVLAIGNPDIPGSHFHAICRPGGKEGAGWKVIHLDGLRSPNMTEAAIVGDDPEHPIYPKLAALMEAEGIPYSTESVPEGLRKNLLSPLWVEERLARWAGIADDDLIGPPEQVADLVRRRAAASALFAAKVRGIFPHSSAEGVVPMGWVQLAMNRHRDWTERGKQIAEAAAPLTIGVDVAYMGQDDTVLAPGYGDITTEIVRLHHADTEETADMAAVYGHEPGSTFVVDIIGIGAGVYDKLRRYKREGHIIARVLKFVANGATWRTDKTSGSFRFYNDRSAAWWHMRELLDPSRGSKVALPDDERLLEELCAPRWKLLQAGVLQVESKDDIKKRLGRSTDTADAVIQRYWISGRGYDYSVEGDECRSKVRVNGREPTGDVVYPDGFAPISEQDLESDLVASRNFASVTQSGRVADKPEYGYFSESGTDPGWGGWDRG